MPGKDRGKIDAGDSRNGRKARRGWILALFPPLVLIGAVLGAAAARMSGERIVAGVSVCGVNLGRLDAASAERLLRQRLAQTVNLPLTLTYGQDSWLATPSSLGISPDFSTTVARAMRVGRRGGILARWRERRRAAAQGIALPLSYGVKTAAWREACVLLDTLANKEPVNAHFSVSAKGELSVTPAVEGRRLDETRLLAALKAALTVRGTRRLEVPVVPIKPDLSNENVANWPLDQVLGFYTTKFSQNASRTHNLQIAAAALDGAIVQPGKEFSFNERVGPRIEGKYQEAPVVVGGRLVLGVGGGVCQVSSTLFNAVLLANLPVIKRASHSLPSTYVPLGRDATVSYGWYDLVFANNTGRPLLIVAEITGSRLTVAVVGHRDLNPSVKLSVEVKEVIPFETLVENDPGLASGVESITQAGQPGYKVMLWRTTTWPDGKTEREQIAPSSYPPLPKIIKRGIGSARYGEWPPAPPAASASGGNP